MKHAVEKISPKGARFQHAVAPFDRDRHRLTRRASRSSARNPSWRKSVRDGDGIAFRSHGSPSAEGFRIHLLLEVCEMSAPATTANAPWDRVARRATARGGHADTPIRSLSIETPPVFPIDEAGITAAYSRLVGSPCGLRIRGRFPSVGRMPSQGVHRVDTTNEEDRRGLGVRPWRGPGYRASSGFRWHLLADAPAGRGAAMLQLPSWVRGAGPLSRSAPSGPALPLRGEKTARR